MTFQPFIKRGTRSNATARRLVASAQQPAPSVLRSTVERPDLKRPIMRCRAEQTITLAGVRVLAGQHFYLVASPKFTGRFYVVVKNITGWQCSSQEVKTRCVRQVEAYRAQLASEQAA